jgi:hypothetical protein
VKGSDLDTKKYDKIKHLVEVDDDILAVFSVESSVIKELYIAENANLDRNYIESLIHILELDRKSYNEKPQTYVIKQESEEEYNNSLGKIKWVVMEYDKIRILKIFENDKIIFVLINSNTQLEHTVDNILGYYYDLDEIPRSLF